MQCIKEVLVLITLVVFQVVTAQDFSNSWVGHFAYLDIKDVSKGDNSVFVAAENAIFKYNTQTNETQKLSTINGLSGETITAIKYVDTQGVLLIGFENGLIQVYNESSGDFLTVVDILDKPTIPPNDKKINHFMIYNGLAYIATNYGISLYDINNLEFDDTYFIGNSGSQIKINQTTVFENYIYAASQSGIYRALINTPNLINFNAWQSFAPANWTGIQVLKNKLYASRTDKSVYEVINTTITQKVVYTDLIQGFTAIEDKLVVTTVKEVHVYQEDFNEIALVVENEEFITNYTRATISNNELYIGTKGRDDLGKPGYGILKTSFLDTTILEEIHPETPLKNKFFKIKTQVGEVWGTHGGHSEEYNFNGGIAKTGLSHLVQDQWNNIPYDVLEETIEKPWFLSYLSINPFNTDEVYVGSHHSGVLRINSENISLLNNNLDLFVDTFYLITASNYDPDGNLWLMNGRVNNSLNKLENGEWSNYSLMEIIDPPTSNLGFSDIAFTDDGKVFIGSLYYGIIGFNENNGDLKFIEDVAFNMPSDNVWAVAADRQNQIWVGTGRGLRVIYNTSEFFDNPNYQMSNIVVLDDGTPSELLFQQYITDIEVDGSNNKWIGTLDTGAYYLSADGQETIFHFTKDNSPLPSNEILDIAIDNENGTVYFATQKGLVAFKSETSKPQETLANAYVFPNPVRPSFNINNDKIKIKGITNNVNIKITDIEGNLVTEAASRVNLKFKGFNLEIDGGTALWNGKNLANVTVASGVYLVMITDLDSFETKVLKLMIVR